MVELADQARDLGDHDGAAELYRRAARALPSRIDLVVQRANMLKDAGRFDEAETVYLGVLARAANPAEIQLQLGHLNKLAGRRAPALEHYEAALALDQALEPALHELAEAGVAKYQILAAENRRQAGEPPNARDGTPVELYGDLRRHFDVPPAGGGEAIGFAIILGLDDASAGHLEDQISAIRAQAHSRWTLTVIGESRLRGGAADSWLTDARVRWMEEPAGLGAELRLAMDIDADWTLLLAAGAVLHPRALAWLAATASRWDCAAIFTDEEVDSASDPTLLKPIPRQIADPYSIAEANLCGETIALSRRVLPMLEGVAATASPADGRWPLFRALIGRQPVAHVPLPLIRRRASVAGADQVTLARPVATSLAASPADAAVLALVIPTKNNSADAQAFIDSLLAHALAPERLEILVINNGEPASSDPILSSLGRYPQVTVRDLDAPFNWSRFSNLGAAWTTAPNLLFANDDMLMLSPGWDQTLLDLVSRPEVGAVGARLVYPDGALQHAGILFDWKGSVIHDGLYRPGESAEAHHRWQVTRAVSAVTGAFLATRRVLFDAVGGFDEERLAISYSDVDYGLKVRSQGLTVVWTPHITAVHYESKTRGLDRLDAAKAERNDRERRHLEARWPGVFEVEPSLNPFWLQETIPFRLLRVPTEARLWDYIERSARLQPWIVAPPRP